MNVDDYLDFEHPADESAAAAYQVFREDVHTLEIIELLKARSLTDHEIVIVFRHVSRIPSEWEAGKEAIKIKDRRRQEMTKRLRALLPNVENDPDLSRLYFGTGEISAGASESEPGQISFAACIRAGIDELEAAAAAETKFPDQDAAQLREMPLKRYAIRTVFSLIETKGKRAPNKLTARIVSILLGEPVTPNDVTQARKDIRQRNYRDE